jgi:hypothetical protein
MGGEEMQTAQTKQLLYTVLAAIFLAAVALGAGAAFAQAPVNRGQVSGHKVDGVFTDTPTETDTPGIPSNTPTATTTPLPCDIVINGSITSTDPRQTDRLRRDGVVSSCGTPKTCPGPFTAGNFAFDTYAYVNTTPATACVTVRLDDQGCGGNDLFSAAYLGSYDPTNVCANYLADMGGSPPGIGSYSFNVPAGARFVVVVHELNSGSGCALYNLRISGLPCQPTPGPSATPCPINFSDVHPTDYFYQSVQYLYCEGAISGYSDGTFRPYNNTTRGQLSKIIVLAEGWAIDTSGGPHFSDVPTTNPFYQYIETAYNHGVISGYADGTFRWGNNVTRAQLSKIVVSAEGWPIITTGGPHFSDVPPTDPFYGYIETAYDHNIISGYADRTFRPGANATRGQISKIVYNAVTSP